MKLGLYYRDLNTNVGDSFDVRSILKGLSKDNEVLVFCSKKNHHKFVHPNIRYFQTNSTFKLLYYIYKNSKDIECFNLFCGLIYTLPFAAMLLKLLNIKYIYYPFGQLMPLAMKKKGKVIKKTFYLYVFLKPMLKRAWRIHANSIYEKKVITQLIGVNKFIIAPLSIEGYELNKLEKVDQKKYYTYIGRLDIWHKGLDIMLEAILMNIESFYKYNVKVIIAGRGEPQEVEMIQELINDFELNNVVILKSNITECEKTEILNQSLFFIHPSRVEGFARSMREAIYLEIPLITTYDSNIGDYIEDYNCGFSSNFDVFSLSKSIQKSFSCINNLSVFDFKLLKKKLTWENTTNIILQEFENLR